MAGLCQDCTGCCEILEVKSVPKEFYEPCKHLGTTSFGKGCSIYATRPLECHHYVCLWLDSQRRMDVEKMPESLRPNVCKVVMGWPWSEDRKALYIYPYPGFENHWRFPPVSEYLQNILARGAKVVVVIGDRRIVLNGNTAMVGTEQEFAELLT